MRDPLTREPIKYKARSNIHGGKQECGVNHYDTFSAVDTWISLRVLFILANIYSWASFKINYVLAFPHAPILLDMYMEIPKGIEVDIGNQTDNKDYILKLFKNLYGQKQAL